MMALPWVTRPTVGRGTFVRPHVVPLPARATVDFAMLSVQVETMRYAAFDAAPIELSWGVAS